MKFAKELEQDAVPEWRDKYLNYKAGKKKLKAVARALRGVERPPQSPEEERKSPFASLRDAPVYSLFNRERQEPAARTGNVDSRDSDTPLMPARSRSEAYAGSLRLQGDNASDSPAFRPIPVNERSPLRAPKKHTDTPQMTRYGSIIGSPPMHAAIVRQNAAPSLELPDPALTLTPFSSAHRSSEQAPRDDEYDRPRSPGSPDTITPQPPLTQLAHTGSAYEIRKAVDGPPGGLLAERYRSILQPRRTNSSPTAGQPAFLRRLMSTTSSRRVPGGSDVALESYREADFRQAEFFTFLDKELEKIELFYKSKEDEASERLKVLKDQLHCMRDRRLEEIVAAEIRKASSRGNNGRNDGSAQAFLVSEGDDGEVLANELDDERLSEDLQNEGAAERPGHHPFKASVDYAQAAMGKARTGRVGKTSKAMEQLGTPPLRVNPNVQQDYTRRLVKDNSVAYRVAKRKLKLALAEFYRGLELMKSYALVNRTAFRKINKKFDKTVNAQPKMRFVTDKVQKSHFVTSDTVDTYISLVEDLYARYFERGNHKLAVGKLRARISKAGHYTGSVFRTGVLAAAGLVFGIQGLVYGVQQLLTSPINHSTQVNFLLQIYGGYFLLLLLTGLFVVDTAIFTAYRVNYQFIFEFDNRNMLDWKQLAEMPSYFLFLLGFTIWCNFSSFGGGKMFIYWPVLLLGLSLALLFCPPPLFYSRSRGWFLYSNWRLLLAGVYPVEFRDFFLGDMYCSQTYAMSNIQTFFCLYANSWENTAQCTSGHSRLLGFFQCLPGIWRLLQCLRRYWDTGNVVPHLANGAKYTCTILQYMSLSIFRIDHNIHTLSFFIVCASVNACYCSFWDLYYDWSQPMQLKRKPYLLREILAYKKHLWWYYGAMMLDPILRFNWIFYVIFRHDTQHASLLSFLVAFSEIIRRGIWVLFRVENEHCTNIRLFRADRMPDLPYDLTEEQEQELEDSQIPDQADGAPLEVAEPIGLAYSRTTAADIEHGRPATAPSTVRQRRREAVSAESPVASALKRAGSTMLAAHSQDYERKRRPVQSSEVDDDPEDDAGSSDED